MVTTTQLRILRHKYNISLVELASKIGISNQHLSRMELGQVRTRPWQEERVAAAIAELIAGQKAHLLNLERDLLLHKGHLLEPMEVDTDEL